MLLLLILHMPGYSQKIGDENASDDGWGRTEEIVNCVPRIVDRTDLVEDNFSHHYVTNNPREAEYTFFSVEPITNPEAGTRFCEARLPAVGGGDSYLRGTYTTSYNLPGERVYRINIESNALIFNNEIRTINAQSTIAEIEATHSVKLLVDSSQYIDEIKNGNSKSNMAYTWHIEIDEDGIGHSEITTGNFDLQETDIPGGNSTILFSREMKGPGVIEIEESVIFRVRSLSWNKYETIFQAICLFNLEPLSISAKLLPCED